MILLSYLTVGLVLAALAFLAQKLVKDPSVQMAIDTRGQAFLFVALVLLWPAALVKMWMDRR